MPKWRKFLRKAENISWGKRTTTRCRVRSSGRTRVTTERRTWPLWASGLSMFLMFAIVVFALNYRGIIEARDEARQNEILNTKVQSLLDENVALQLEINTLKTDKTAIEREASRIGLDLKAQTSLVPSN